MTFGENLRRIRADLGYSQTNVATKLGITRQGYNHYETGKRIPPLDIMENLCSIFNIDMNELTDFDDPKTWLDHPNFSDRLKRLRVKSGLTQGEFGKIFGFSNQRYNYYETGKREPDNETIKLFAKYFSVTTDYLLGNTDDPIPSNAIKKSDAEDFSDAIKKIFVDAGKITLDEELSPEFKEYTMGLIRAAVALDKHFNKM